MVSRLDHTPSDFPRPVLGKDWFIPWVEAVLVYSYVVNIEYAGLDLSSPTIRMAMIARINHLRQKNAKI